MQTCNKRVFNISAVFLLALLGAGVSLLPGATWQKDSPQAKAADNLVKESSFEEDIQSNWAVWSSEDSSRSYELYRAYDAAYGYGSYSAAVDASGQPTDPFQGLLNTNTENNPISVKADTEYFLAFYAKSSQDTEINAYLQQASGDHNALTSFPSASLTGQWQKFIFSFTPDASGDVTLSFVIGDMPEDSTLYLDGLSLLEKDFKLRTDRVRGNIGDEDQMIRINNISDFTTEDITVELPYYDSEEGTTTTRHFHPERMNNNGIYINYYESTFAGIGRVYVNDYYVGNFNYDVQPEVSEIHPSLPRAGADLGIHGSGFSPVDNQTYVVMKATDVEGGNNDIWIKPKMFDSKLSQVVVGLPPGVVAGRLYVQTSYINTQGEEVVNKSNSTSYKIKPRVTNINWSKKGYEHVGDVMRIYGLGISKNPRVKFYDDKGQQVEARRAQVVDIGDVEVIEVEATKKYNEFDVTVTTAGVESDIEDSLTQSAKPKLKDIKSNNSRKMYASDNRLNAARVGEEIKLRGHGFKSNTGSTTVEFEGINGRISVPVTQENVHPRGRWINVNVPAGAKNGYINVRANGMDSNYMPIEVIPTVESISPDPLVPGQDMTIRATGVGNNLNLAKVHFVLDKNENLTKQPFAIDYDGNKTVVHVKAPLAVSHKNTEVNLQYDRWSDEGESYLNVNPTITRASINPDNNVLSIKGYGFSIHKNENKITYKYADENKTVIEPKTRMLGVYPTEEGQEIRVQLLDDYHYGFVSVTVGDYTSNEVNFGPVKIRRINRRVEYVPSVGQEQGVLYINGYNFGDEGGVRVGEQWADVHYRSDFFIIAVIDKQHLYGNPVTIARR